jgi:hypothetical protein
MPGRLRMRLTRRLEGSVTSPLHQAAGWTLAVVVALLSTSVVRNLASPNQAMNRSFDALHLVNTYGAFGSIGRARSEIVLEGTSDPHPGPDTTWRPYEFPCKPGDPERRPCVVSPYHYRLDWQLWFAAMSSIDREPWLVRLVAKLLRGDADVKPLLANDPFPDDPPRFVRAELWRYRFTQPGESATAWWRRTRIRIYLRPVSLDDPDLRAFLARSG